MKVKRERDRQRDRETETEREPCLLSRLEPQPCGELPGGVNAAGRHKAGAEDSLVAEDAVASVLTAVQEVPQVGAAGGAAHYLHVHGTRVGDQCFLCRASPTACARHTGWAISASCVP
jgi:hypothetical protein